MRIYKYPLEICEKQHLVLPVDAEILTLQLQNGTPTIWCEVDTTSMATELCQILMVGTGQDTHVDIEAGIADYLGTVQMQSGLVWHYYQNGYFQNGTDKCKQ